MSNSAMLHAVGVAIVTQAYKTAFLTRKPKCFKNWFWRHYHWVATIQRMCRKRQKFRPTMKVLRTGRVNSYRTTCGQMWFLRAYQYMTP